jgi:hypothetical protein
MKETIRAYRGCDPQALLEHLEAEGGMWLLKSARGAQFQLYSMFEGMEYPRKDGYLANFWSDLKYELLFPNYVKKGSRKDELIIQDWLLRTNGGRTVMEMVLTQANLARDWNPDMPYSPQEWEELMG